MVMIVPGDKNEVGIGGLTDARLRAGDYSGSGLEALGAGLAKLGESGAGFAQALGENHQRNRDDAAVKQAYVAFSDAVAPLLHGDDGMLNREGADAHAAFPDVASGLADAYDQTLAPLSPQQRALVAPALADRLRNYVALSGQHVRQQGAVEQRRQSEALQQSAARDAVAHVGDPDLHERYLSTGENALRQQAMIDKLPAGQADQQLAQYRSGVHADSIDALTPQDPVRAAGYYGRVAGAMTDPDRQMIEKTLDPALAHARSIADVDAAAAADSATAPTTPHADDPHTLLLKMEGITPEGDQPQLPALLQRYHGDAARAWAAFAAGPDYLDKLIAAKGDNWYASVGDDVRRFVDHNIALLGASGSARTLPDDPQAAAARIAAQDWDDPRKAAARRELQLRALWHEQATAAAQQAAVADAQQQIRQMGAGYTSLAQLDPRTRRMLPPDAAVQFQSQAGANIDPESFSRPGEPAPQSTAPAGDTLGADRNDAYEITDTGATDETGGTGLPGTEGVVGIDEPAADGVIEPNTPSSSGTRGNKPKKPSPPAGSAETISRNRAQAEADLQDPHFRALMLLIGRYEGPDNPNIGNGYYTINRHLKKGDGLKDLSRFPTELGEAAVGRYQMKQHQAYAYASPALGITSFNPHDQDLMAAYIIRRRGMFEALSSGDFRAAAAKIHRIWASFPDGSGKVQSQQQVDFDTFVRDYKAEITRVEQSDVVARQLEATINLVRSIGYPVPKIDPYGALPNK